MWAVKSKYVIRWHWHINSNVCVSLRIKMDWSILTLTSETRLKLLIQVESLKSMETRKGQNTHSWTSPRKPRPYRNHQRVTRSRWKKINVFDFSPTLLRREKLILTPYIKFSRFIIELYIVLRWLDGHRLPNRSSLNF